MTKLILLRHGETDWNKERRYQGHQNVPLNALGQRQAVATGHYLSHHKIDAIYTSDLPRATQTTSIVNRHHHLTISADPRLRELSCGIIEGLTYDMALEKYPEVMKQWMEDRNQPPPGGEKMKDFSNRIADSLQEYQQKHAGETILLVTHGGTIQEMLRSWLGMTPDGIWHFRINNGSVSTINIVKEFPIVEGLNYCPPVEGEVT